MLIQQLIARRMYVFLREEVLNWWVSHIGSPWGTVPSKDSLCRSVASTATNQNLCSNFTLHLSSAILVKYIDCTTRWGDKWDKSGQDRKLMLLDVEQFLIIKEKTKPNGMAAKNRVFPNALFKWTGNIYFPALLSYTVQDSFFFVWLLTCDWPQPSRSLSFSIQYKHFKIQVQLDHLSVFYPAKTKRRHLFGVSLIPLLSV